MTIGRIIATGVNAQGVPWKEISFIEEKEENKTKTFKERRDIIRDKKQ